MPEPRSKTTAGKKATPMPARVKAVLAELEAASTQHDRDGMVRYGITAAKAYGVRMLTMQQLAKRLGTDRALAAALWKTGWYEARTVAAYIEDPQQVTSAEMDRWAKDFDNWGICDTVCFKLWDRSPLAWAKIKAWSTRKEEFVKRASFALLASVALHDKRSPDAPFLSALSLIERASMDERNFVKKGVLWALRGIGGRSRATRDASLALAQRLAASEDPTARWIGREAHREMTKKRKG